MGLMHHQIQTFYWKVHTVRSGRFKVIGLLESFHFSMCSSGFQVAMRGNIFKSNMCVFILVYLFISQLLNISAKPPCVFLHPENQNFLNIPRGQGHFEHP